MPPDFEGQARLVWRHLGEALAAAGMTYADLVLLRFYLASAGDDPANVALIREHLGDHSPAAPSWCSSCSNPSGGSRSRPSQRGWADVPQPALRTDRLVLEPLADEHLDLEIELDSDAEVLRYLSPRAHTPDETRAKHAERARARSPGRRPGHVDGVPRRRPVTRRVVVRRPLHAHAAARPQPAEGCRAWPTSATGSAATAGARASPARALSSCSATPSRPSASTG